MESVVEVFMEKEGAPVCAKMGQEKASSFDFARIECASQEFDIADNSIRQADRHSKPKEQREVSPEGRIIAKKDNSRCVPARRKPGYECESGLTHKTGQPRALGGSRRDYTWSPS